MRALLGSFGVLALAACSLGERSYEMTVDEAGEKLLSARFEHGIIPGSSMSEPRVARDYYDKLEWHVLDTHEGHGNGFWCPLSIEPTRKDGKRVKVINKCSGLLSYQNAHLDELVDATLTGRPVKFD